MSASGALSDRIGPRSIVAVGAIGAAVSLSALAMTSTALTAPEITGTVLLGMTVLTFGTVSAPTFASIYRILPEVTVGRGATAALFAVQLGAAVGVTGIGTIIDLLGDDAFSVVPAILAALILVSAVIATVALAGRASKSTEA